MRLDKLTIGSPKDSPTHHFKNLKNVTIDFDQDQWITVVIGWNGSGKSNVMEALITIFRDLIHDRNPGKKRAPEFAFKLLYRMGSGEKTLHICIDADPDRVSDQYIIHVATAVEKKDADAKRKLFSSDDHFDPPPGKALKFNTFVAEDNLYLPRYVFGYYSGESTRMHEAFVPYLKWYDKSLRGNKYPKLKRLFYALPVHSHFVLLAFMIKQNDVVRKFLVEELGIDPDEGIESVLFALRQPPWKSKDGDSRFWYARGVVRDFLSRLYHIALAPIRLKRRVDATLWNKATLEFLYLYVKDIDALLRLVGDQTPAEFFRDLESTFVSEMIEEVRIRVKLNKNNDSITFRELSEGEQQLLTVLGLLRFTSGEESLFLLDEPDTHLNPRWSVDYISYLEKFAGSAKKDQETSHIVLTTHNPLSIAELVKEQVQILQLKRDDTDRQIIACHPELDPQGQGYAAIVTSDMFGIASSLDKPTQKLLEEQRLYAGKKTLTEEEQKELDKINKDLDRLGFRFFHPDDEYSRYLRLRSEVLTKRFDTEDVEVLAAHTMEMTREEREELAEQLIRELDQED